MRILKGEAVFDLYRYAYLLPSCAGTEEVTCPALQIQGHF